MDGFELGPISVPWRPQMRAMASIILSAVLLCGSVSAPINAAQAEDVKSMAELERDLKAAVRRSPGDVAAVTNLGAVYWELGRKYRAIFQFRKALRIDPDYPIPYYFLGEAYFLERKPEKALANYKLFIEKMDLQPDLDEELKDYYISRLYTIGRRFWAMKEHRASLEVFDRIVDIDPEDPRAYYNRAVYFYNHFFNRPRAFAQLNKVIELAPSSRIAAKAEFFIDYMRRNPDARVIGDFRFIDED